MITFEAEVLRALQRIGPSSLERLRREINNGPYVTPIVWDCASPDSQRELLVDALFEGIRSGRVEIRRGGYANYEDGAYFVALNLLEVIARQV